MFFIKIYIKESYMNYYDTSIQMCGQYCILAPNFVFSYFGENSQQLFKMAFHAAFFLKIPQHQCSQK